MDCVIPGHSVRTFCNAISCLSKIGQDLYVDFDPMDGLALRTLNDAKSAFCVVEFGPSFFERCTTPAAVGSSRKRSHAAVSTSTTSSSQTTSGSGSQELRFNCRVPMRALVPVVRPRKGVVTLRVRSEGHDNNNNNDVGKNNNPNLQLAFEYHVEISNPERQPTYCKLVHKMGVANVDSIAAVAPKEECSELVAAPKVLVKWLEPIKRTAEACLIFTKDASTVVATSFNSSDTSYSSLATATKNILKTETSIALEDLEDYVFVDQRIDSNEETDHLGMPQCPMPGNVNEEVVLVFGIKEAKALLHFCSQGASAAMSHHHGGSSAHWGADFGDDTNHNKGNNNHNPWSVALSFHWAGRPLVWEAKGNSVSIQLVLATLDHQILKDMPIMAVREQQQKQQQRG